ncbi:MAG TPA: response regulator [Caldimonas sp.]
MKIQPGMGRIMVASDNSDDAAQIVKQLTAEHEHVRASTTADLAVADFEEFKPDVLVLAFDSIEKAERYSLGLFRQSQVVSHHPHRTVLLCAKDEVRAAFDLCKKGVFDDYVLQWPLAHDGFRLVMSVWNAARALQEVSSGPRAKELLEHAEQLAAIDSLLHQQLAEGRQHAASAAHRLKQTEAAVGAAIDEFSQRLTSSARALVVEVKDPAGLAREFDRLKKDRVAPAFKAAAEGIAPIAAWAEQVQEQLASHMAGVRGFARKVGEVRWIVMVVEDDEFARKLIAKALQEEPYDLVFAPDGTAALAALRRARPDLILMDINLPDMDGVTLTRNLKAVPHLADIPVLMLTGDARRETLAHSMSAGAAGFIVKPFTRESLVAKLSRFLSPPA